METLDRTVLASLLEPLDDCEGILICAGEVPFRDEDSVKRLFSTFQFFGTDGLNGGQHYRYANTGVIICHTGPSINLLIGDDVSEAVPDLMRALDQMGWQNVDVYSRHGQAFFDDLVKNTPASVQLDVSLRDIPSDMSSDLRELARQVSMGTVANAATDEANFMNMLRSESGLPLADPPPAIPVHQPISAHGMGVAVGIANNYVPDAATDEFAPIIPSPIHADDEISSNASPPRTSAGAAPVGTARPVIALATASPVAASTDAGQIKAAATPAASPAPADRPTQMPAQQRQPVQTARMETAQTQEGIGKTFSAAAPSPATAATARRAFVSRIEPPPHLPDAPIVLGDSLVVVCTPGCGYSDDALRTLAEDRGVVIYEPGATALTDRHVGWDLVGENAGVDLVAALWPNERQDHLAIHALLAMARHQPTPHALADLLALAATPVDAGPASRLAEAEVDAVVTDYLRMQHRLGLLELSLWRVIVDLWSAATLASAQSSTCVSFSALAARRTAPLLVVVRIDALDTGCAAEFLAFGLLRWISRLADSQRISAAPIVSPSTADTEQLVTSLISGMTPEQIAIFQSILQRQVKPA